MVHLLSNLATALLRAMVLHSNPAMARRNKVMVLLSSQVTVPLNKVMEPLNNLAMVLSLATARKDMAMARSQEAIPTTISHPLAIN